MSLTTCFRFGVSSIVEPAIAFDRIISEARSSSAAESTTIVVTRWVRALYALSLTNVIGRRSAQKGMPLVAWKRVQARRIIAAVAFARFWLLYLRPSPVLDFRS